MPKKTLSDLIMNFSKGSNGVKGGYFDNYKYEPAKKLTTPIGKKYTKPNISDLQPKIDYKKEYEELLYKKLYSKIKPHPKDIYKQPESYDAILEQHAQNLISKNKDPSFTINNITKKNTKSSAPSEISFDEEVGFGDNLEDSDFIGLSGYQQGSKVPSPAYVSGRNTPTPILTLTELRKSREPVSLYGNEDEETELFETFRPPEYGKFEPLEHRQDNYDLDREFNTNISNYASLKPPQKAYLPFQESEIAVEAEPYEYVPAEPFIPDISPEQIRYYLNTELPKIPKKDLADLQSNSNTNADLLQQLRLYKSMERSKTSGAKQAQLTKEIQRRSKAYNEERAKDEYIKAKYFEKIKKQAEPSPIEVKKQKNIEKAKTSSSPVAQKIANIEQRLSPIPIIGEGLRKHPKRKLKKHSLLGGKISVGNLTKFFKSSYAGKKAPEKIDTYNLDKEITNKYATVYYDPEKNHAVITHKGTSGDTKLETLKDWGNNAAYALGLYKYTDRYKQGKKLQEATEQKYGAQNVSTLGHSQGAKLARDLGQNSKEIINLNPAYMGEKPLKNEYNIRSSGDLVSVALAPTNRAHDTVIPAESYNPLTEHKIDILDRIDQQKMIGGKKRKYVKR